MWKTARRCWTAARQTQRCLSTTSTSNNNVQRESMPFDVVIVGGGPAGLSAAIEIKKLAGDSLSVCLIDKGSEIGSHILSGNVLDPSSLEELLTFDDGNGSAITTDWKQELYDATGSIATPVTRDEFLVLPSATGTAWSIPSWLLPPQLHNTGNKQQEQQQQPNVIISLSQLCRYLAQTAESLGVEIYPGFAASDLLLHHNDDGTPAVVQGVVTRDVGLDQHGRPKEGLYEPGVELRARQTLLAEGARGSCTKALMEQFGVRSTDNTTHHHEQTYGLGLKEVWQIPPEQHQAGLVQHTIGWPLQSNGLFDKTFGGSFLYHQAPDLVLVGLVVGLDYANPYLNPYKAFQQWKTHPAVAAHLRGGTCLSYGARVLNEGGYHAIPPTLAVPGAQLLGCGAGFLNTVKIKGTHTAIRSGLLAARATVAALQADDDESFATDDDDYYRPPHVTAYQTAIHESSIAAELYQVRNTHAAFSRWGVGPGLAYTALSTWLTRGREPWTIAPAHARDCDATVPAAAARPIEYNNNTQDLTFDLLTNLQRSGVYHAEDQPVHLRVKPDAAAAAAASWPDYAGPESRFCPAGVYEYVPENSDSDEMKLVINSQNCIHCKCCSIKTCQEFIEWTVPEGGGGPQYQIM